ncbi:MAG: phosphate signaling complex protein PhoU [Armatimonadota bacterium]
MNTEEGFRSSYREHLADLRIQILRLGTFAADMLAKALQALAEQNLELAGEVRRSDDVADDLDREIEKASISMLASQQPVSGDLRAIIGALRIATDLERVADYSKDIAKVALAIGDQRPLVPLERLLAMGALTGDILRLALRAVADQDLEVARTVAERDEEIDELWHALWRELNEQMKSQPEIIPQASYMLLVARYLERIGDHTVNVVERLNYIETGKSGHLV